MSWTTPTNSAHITWPNGWTQLGTTTGDGRVYYQPANPPPRTPPVTRINHPEIHDQRQTTSPNEELHTGTLSNGNAFRFTYQNGYAKLGLGATYNVASLNHSNSPEWGIGAPTENAFADSHERDAVFKGMLNARRSSQPPTAGDPFDVGRISARPDWHTHFAQGGTITAPVGWTDADIVNQGPADHINGRTHVSIGSRASAEPDGRPHATRYSINDWNRLVREAQHRINEQQASYANTVYTFGGPTTPPHVPGATCECTFCTARRNITAGLEATRRRVDQRAASSGRDPINWNTRTR